METSKFLLFAAGRRFSLILSGVMQLLAQVLIGLRTRTPLKERPPM